MSGDHYSDDYRHGFTNGHAAGRQAAYDGEEPRGYGQALRDMTARALAAEAALANAQGMEGLAVSMWNEVDTAARSAANGDAEPPRSVATDAGLDLFLRVQNALADAEARGRAHGLLAAAWMLAGAEQKNRACVEPRRSTENWWETRANAFKGAIGGIERLAAEATDGQLV